MVRLKYCGTVGKPGGNRENKPQPTTMGASSLLENRHCLKFVDTFHWTETAAKWPLNCLPLSLGGAVPRSTT